MNLRDVKVSTYPIPQRAPCQEQRDWVQSIEKWSDITDVSFLEATYRVGTRPSSGTIAKSKTMPT